jgi:hypothetical protein
VITDIEYVRSLEARLEELRTAADQADAEYRSEIDILREQIADMRLTDEEREAIAGAIAAEHERGSWAWAHTLSVLLERMGDTPAAHATLGEGSEQNRCTLTDDERAAVGWCVEMAMSSATDCVDEIRTLRGLLERLAPPTA